MSARRLLAVLVPALAVPTAVIALIATLGAAFSWPVDTSDPLAGVTAVAGAGAWLIAAWWTVATAAAVLGRLPGALGRTATGVARRITPAAVRGLVVALSGAALAGSTAPAFAAAPPTPLTPGITLPVPGEPSTPARPVPASRPAAPPSPPDRLPRSHVRVVHAGDSLWSIAAAELGPEAGVQAVARRWQQWWSANEAVIGTDPAHLVPGEQLTAPPASAA